MSHAPHVFDGREFKRALIQCCTNLSSSLSSNGTNFDREQWTPRCVDLENSDFRFVIKRQDITLHMADNHFDNKTSISKIRIANHNVNYKLD